MESVHIFSILWGSQHFFTPNVFARFKIILVNNAKHFHYSREGIESILPPNAHEIAENRLYVSVTNTRNGENHLVSNFASREDLIKVMMLNIAALNKNASVSSRLRRTLLALQ